MQNIMVAKAPLHPVMWVAAVSVTLLSIAGISSLMGWLPSKSNAVVPAVSVVAASAVPSAAVPALAAPAEVVALPVDPPAPLAEIVPAPAPVPAKPRKLVKKPAIPLPAANLDARVPPPPPMDAGIPPDYVPPPPVTAVAPAPTCLNCGVIDVIREIEHEGRGSGVGAVAGGLIGGLLANNVGKGGGRALATMAGAVGGGLLGNQIEKSQHKSSNYQITVLMEDGTTRLVNEPTSPAWRIGDQVRLVNGMIVSR